MEMQRFRSETLFAAGRLCLDFINTACEVRGVALELLGTSAELRQWLLLAEGVSQQPLCPDEVVWNAGYGETALPRAIALRTALDDLVRGVMEQRAPSATAIAAVNAILRANPSYSQIGSDGAGFAEAVTVWHPEDRWMVAIVRDAVDLLCHSDLSLLRQCECATCVRVFYDTTKNHKRRWCVEKCSSQTKAAAYYRRKKARGEAAKTAG